MDTPPFFPDDDRADVRAAQADLLPDSVDILRDAIERLYVDCWVVTGCPRDPIREALRENDAPNLRPMLATHDLLAAYWRRTELPGVAADTDMAALLDHWQSWLRAQPAQWLPREPALVRTLARYVSGKAPGLLFEQVTESWNLVDAFQGVYDLSLIGLSEADTETATCR